MLRVGITGNMGSGKTTACKIFESLNIPIYYADTRAKWLLENHPDLIENVKKLLGNEAYINHRLNKNYISEKVFHQPDLLAKYNALVHPIVLDDYLTWTQINQNEKYIIKESAILIETGGHLNLDKIIVVTAPLDVAIQRVMQRDGLSKNQILARLKQQQPASEITKYADFIIQNDGSKDLTQQVNAIHQQLLLETY